MAYSFPPLAAAAKASRASCIGATYDQALVAFEPPSATDAPDATWPRPAAAAVHRATTATPNTSTRLRNIIPPSLPVPPAPTIPGRPRLGNARRPYAANLRRPTHTA